jgi:hypothetical protein
MEEQRLKTVVTTPEEQMGKLTRHLTPCLDSCLWRVFKPCPFPLPLVFHILTSRWDDQVLSLFDVGGRVKLFKPLPLLLSFPSLWQVLFWPTVSEVFFLWPCCFGPVAPKYIMAEACGGGTAHIMAAGKQRGRGGIRVPISPSMACLQWLNFIPLSPSSYSFQSNSWGPWL